MKPNMLRLKRAVPNCEIMKRKNTKKPNLQTSFPEKGESSTTDIFCLSIFVLYSVLSLVTLPIEHMLYLV